MTGYLCESLPDAPPPCTVLVVDDDELIRSLLTVFLESAGYEVATAESAQQALMQIEATRCEVVIADWQMPDMDGPSFCRQIRNRQRNTYLYVLLFTIRGDSEDVVAGLQAGADDYIVKGAPMAELIARLESGRRLIANRADSRSRPRRRLQWLADVYPTLGPTSGPTRVPTLEPASGPTGGPDAPPKHLPNLAIALAREFERCRGREAPISLLLCAPDDVAGLSECLGAQVSSAFLEGLRAEVPKHLLESEWVARCGCEGFVVVLPDTGLEGASLVARKIRAAIEAAGAGLAVGVEPIAATVSIGVASIDTGRDLKRLRPAHLLRASEQCLAQSRQNGGNTTTSTRVVPES
jgi:two-component system, cell cycle response regulator